MYYKIIIFISIICISCNCTHNSQTNDFTNNTTTSVVEKGWFISKREFAGIVHVDENGKKMKGTWVNNFVYFALPETNTYKWNNFIFNNKKFTVDEIGIKNEETLLGNDKNTNQPVVIKPSVGKKLYQIRIIDFPDTLIAEKIKFTLQGLINNKKVKIKFNESIIELEPELRP